MGRKRLYKTCKCCPVRATHGNWCEVHYARWHKHGDPDMVYRRGPSKPGWEDRFFVALIDERHAVRAAQAAGVSKSLVYRRRQQDAMFDQLWRDILYSRRQP